MQQKISPSLWFDTESEEAAGFYTSIFEDSRIINVTHYTEGAPREAGMVMTVEFELSGQRFVAINGGPDFKFDEAISLEVACKDQAEVDYFWEKLGAGGEYGPCGWLKDKYGLSWQVVPRQLYKLIRNPNKAKARTAMNAMLQMGKIEVAGLEAAAANA